MTTAHDILRTMSIFRFHTLTNNLNFFKPIKTHIKPEALKSLYRSPGNKKKPIGPMYKLCPVSSWNYDQHKKHKVCKGPSND